ncbi:MAG TPA: hypothetical protein VLK82_10520 [Candidatus Tectomicrobia bacterium]|nr:hypothetical protein [Candidatus Tectomicrobia bacterium]
MAWKTISIFIALFCTSASAMPFGKTPFGELIHSRWVAADIVVHVDNGDAERIFTRLQEHPDATCVSEGCMLEASLIELPNGRRLGTRLACGREESRFSCRIALETNAPDLKHDDRSRLLNLKIRLTDEPAESLYSRLVPHPEAFNTVGNCSRERTLNIALLERGPENAPTESRVFCSERPHGGMVCVLKIEYQEGSFPSSGINVLD